MGESFLSFGKAKDPAKQRSMPVNTGSSRFWLLFPRRKKQRDTSKQHADGVCNCFWKDYVGGDVSGIWIVLMLRGEARVLLGKLVANIASTTLQYWAYKSYYSNFPKTSEEIEKYMRPKNFAWVANSNKASMKMQKHMTVEPTGKVMDQYVMPGFCF